MDTAVRARALGPKIALQSLDAPVTKDVNSLVCLTGWEHKPDTPSGVCIRCGIGRRAPGGHLPAGDGLDDLLLRPQGVAGADGHDLDPAAPRPAQAALHRFHGAELVPLGDHHRPAAPQAAGQKVGPPADLLRPHPWGGLAPAIVIENDDRNELYGGRMIPLDPGHIGGIDPAKKRVGHRLNTSPRPAAKTAFDKTRVISQYLYSIHNNLTWPVCQRTL